MCLTKFSIDLHLSPNLQAKMPPIKLEIKFLASELETVEEEQNDIFHFGGVQVLSKRNIGTSEE
jgi:hypothetical protein